MLWLLNSEFEHCLKHKTNSFESIGLPSLFFFPFRLFVCLLFVLAYAFLINCVEVKHLVWYLSVATIFLACFAVVAVYVVVAFSSKTQNSAVMP